jgi:type I restriction enzyme S subunit
VNTRATVVLPFEAVVDDVSAGNNKVQKGDYLPVGAYPVVDQGQEFVGGFSNDEGNLVAGDGPWIVFGDHTRVLKYVDFPFCMGADGVKVLKPRPENATDTKYLFHFLNAKEVPSAGYSRHYRFLKRLEIPLPPLDEQRRVAAILDKADTLRRKRNRALELLDRVTRSTFLEMFGDPAKNTHGFQSIKLDEIGEWRSGGTPPRGQAKYFQGNIPWFSSGELNSIYVNESAEKLTEEALVETSAREVPPNSLMLGMYDTAALKSSISTVRSSCNQAIAFAQIDNSRAETLYVYFAIQIGKDEFRSQQRGVRQKNLNLSMIKDIEIPLPPLNTQRTFVEIFKKNARVSEAFQRSIIKANDLFASLQFRAFAGDLS